MKYTIEDSTLTSIADAIREQYQDDSPINPLDMAEAILGIEGGGSGGTYDSEEFERTFVNLTSEVVIPTTIPVEEIESIDCVCNGTPPNNANDYIRFFKLMMDKPLTVSKDYNFIVYSTYWGSNDRNMSAALNYEVTDKGIKIDLSSYAVLRYFANNGSSYTFTVHSKSAVVPSETRMPQGIEYGEIELMADETSAITVEHNCGQIPNMFLIWADGFTDKEADDKTIFKNYSSVACWTTNKSDGTNVAYGCKTWICNNQGTVSYSNYGGQTSVDENTISIGTRASTYPWRKENLFKWLAIYW